MGVLGGFPVGGERLLGVGAEPHGERGLARHPDPVLRHQAARLVGRPDGDVVDVVAVVVAGELPEDAGDLLGDHLRPAVPHGVDAELPPEFVRPPRHRMEHIGGDPDRPEETGTALVGLERPEDRRAEAAVHAHLDRPDPEPVVAVAGDHAERFERLDLGLDADLGIVVGVVAGAQPDLHRGPRQFVPVALVELLDGGDPVRAHPGDVHAGDPDRGERLERGAHVLDPGFGVPAAGWAA